MRHIPKSTKLIIGRTRTISKFLIFPKTIGEETRWLERATIRQMVIKVDVGGSMEWGNYENQWVDVMWVNK